MDGFGPYSGAFGDDLGEVRMDMNGSFVSGPDSPVQGTIGTIDLDGISEITEDYFGTGTFAAEAVVDVN